MAVSERTLRWASAGVGLLLLAMLGGTATLAARVARSRAPFDTTGSTAAASVDDSLTRAEMDALRATVSALHGTLDTIRATDAMLHEVAGVTPADSASLQAHATLRRTRASADSLLRGASAVAGRIEALADTTRARSANGALRRPPRTNASGSIQR